MTRFLVSRLLAAVYVAIATYSLISIVAGPGGLIAESRLAGHSARMRANLESLKAINRGLGSELEALRSDPDRARREARDLGYIGFDEIEVVIPGRGPAMEGAETPGGVLVFEAPTVIADGEIKALALLCAAVFFGAGLALRKSGSVRQAARMRPPKPGVCPKSRASQPTTSGQPGLFPS